MSVTFMFGIFRIDFSILFFDVLSKIIKEFEITDSLIILDKSSKEKVEKSMRNIPNIKVTDINHFSAFDMIKFKKIVFTESSVKELEKRYA